MLSGENAMLPFEQFEADRGTRSARSVGAKRFMRGLEDHGGGRFEWRA
jgi:hypothetical protein